MAEERKVLVYGGSGYTGKLVAESLAQRNIPFYLAGRTRERLETVLAVVKERHDGVVDAEIVTASNTVEELQPLFAKVDVVINVAGPFMQIAWPIVEAALLADCHYLDTTGEQDWTNAIKQKYGQSFADKGLLLCPANSYMWAAGSIAAEVVLETEGVDSLDIVYQIDHGLPSEASTKSFLRMPGSAVATMTSCICSTIRAARRMKEISVSLLMARHQLTSPVASAMEVKCCAKTRCALAL